MLDAYLSLPDIDLTDIPPPNVGDFIFPIQGGTVEHIFRSFGLGHAAIDITWEGITGTPVLAAADGVVVLSRYNYYGYGHTVIVEHGDGLHTLYAHCAELLVEHGETVTQGQPIATVGSTGRTVGPHLHFEVRYGNTLIDPMDFLQ
jgi:murein DD-endopeptidase MepM/ murein hydrolase activator NlpD